MVRPDNPAFLTTPRYIRCCIDFINERLLTSTGQELVLRKIEEINSSNSFTYLIDTEVCIEDAPYIRTELNLLHCGEYLNILGDYKGKFHNHYLDNIDAYLDCDIALYELMASAYDLYQLTTLGRPHESVFSLGFEKIFDKDIRRTSKYHGLNIMDNL